MQVSKTRIILSLGVGIVAASFASIIIRLAQAAGMPSLVIAAWRLIFASMILVPYAWFARRDEIRSLSRREGGLLAAAGLCLGLHFATWISSLEYTSVASAVVLVSMGPVFVGLGSWLFLHERLGRRTMAGIALTVVGSIVIGLSDFGHGENALLGDLLALAGAVFVAAYLMIGRKVRGSRSLTTYVTLVYGFAMVCLLIMVLISRLSLFGYSPEAYGWALALGLGPQLIGHSALNWALGYLSATFVSIVTLAEPIGAGILAYLVLGEAITAATAIGAVLVLGGIYIASKVELD
jgi:drug/metabolite transporter (DMT)-like permease